MCEPNPYILSFNCEQLIKIGITDDLSPRLAQLGGSFNLSESYVIESTDKRCVRLIEASLHAIFAEHRASSTNPLASGNTEIFYGRILQEVLNKIEQAKSFFSHAQIEITKGINEEILGRFQITMARAIGCKPSEIYRSRKAKTAKVSEITHRKNGSTYQYFMVSWYIDGERKRVQFARRREAENYLSSIK
jgi:hypothetical protein